MRETERYSKKMSPALEIYTQRRTTPVQPYNSQRHMKIWKRLCAYTSIASVIKNDPFLSYRVVHNMKNG